MATPSSKYIRPFLGLVLLSFFQVTRAVGATPVQQRESPKALLNEGELLLKQRNYPQALDKLTLSLKVQGIDTTIFSNGKQAILPNVPLQMAATSIREWAIAYRACKLQSVLDGATPDRGSLVTAITALGISRDILDRLRESVQMDDALTIREMDAEYRKTTDFALELLFIFSSIPLAKNWAFQISNSSHAKTLMEFLWKIKMKESPGMGRALAMFVAKNQFLEEQAEPKPNPATLSFLRSYLRDSANSFTAKLSGVSLESSRQALSLKTSLRVGKAILQFHVTEDFVLAFFISEIGEIKFKMLDDNTDGLRTMANAYRNTLVQQGSNWEYFSQRLYVKLLSDFDIDLEETNHLVIIPSRFLFGFPFATLLDPRTGLTLAQKVEISYLPHPDMLPFCLQSNKDYKLDGVAVGVDHYASKSALRFSKEEAESVQKSFGPWVKVIDSKTTHLNRESFLSTIRGKRLVHFSGHAFADNRIMLSHLLLPGEGKEDISVNGLDFIRADPPLSIGFMSLSACYTGKLGQTTEDNPFGLATALIMSGTSAILCSNWEIGDSTTSRFMENFYKSFSKPMTTASGALRETQLKYLSQTKGHPEVWGAFSIVGNGDFAVVKQ